MAASSLDPNPSALIAHGWGRLSQQILNLLDLAAARAAEHSALNRLDRRDLDDCGLTPADVALGLPDLYAHDFRVVEIAKRRAA